MILRDLFLISANFILLDHIVCSLEQLEEQGQMTWMQLAVFLF